MQVTRSRWLPCSYMVNTLKIFFPGTTKPILTKLCMKHQSPKPFIICANNDLGMTLTYFPARSKFATEVFTWKNVTMMDSLIFLHPVTWKLVNIVK